MRVILFICFLVFLASPLAAHNAKAEVIISEEDQKKRDSDKEFVLKNELAQEQIALAEVKQLVSIAEATQDFQNFETLKVRILQHETNIRLLNRELNPTSKRGGDNREKSLVETSSTPEGGGNKRKEKLVKTSTKSGLEDNTTKPAWWDSYSRQPSITIY